MQKGFGFIGILIIVGIVAGIGAFVFMYPFTSNHEKKSAIDMAEQVKDTLENKSDDIANDEISNWKTYRNEKYGFEVRYPPSFFIYTTCLTSKGGSQISFCIEKEAVSEYFFGSRGDVGKRFLAFEVGPADEYDDNSCIGNLMGEVVVDNQIYVQCMFDDDLRGEQANINITREGKHAYIFSNSFSGNGNIVNQIISTFKFLP